VIGLKTIKVEVVSTGVSQELDVVAIIFLKNLNFSFFPFEIHFIDKTKIKEAKNLCNLYI